MKRKDCQEEHNFLVKTVMIGDSAVGKTNILLRFTSEHYRPSYVSTIGVDFRVKSVLIEGVKIKMHIWDTAGQERFKNITQTYYKGAVGVILVYSVTDRNSFNNLESWIKQINQIQGSICKVIVGNKSDCHNQRKVTYEEGANLATREGAGFMECSAKENINVTEIFNIMGKSIKDKLTVQSPPQNNLKITKPSGKVKFCGC